MTAEGWARAASRRKPRPHFPAKQTSTSGDEFDRGTCLFVVPSTTSAYPRQHLLQLQAPARDNGRLAKVASIRYSQGGQSLLGREYPIGLPTASHL